MHDPRLRKGHEWLGTGSPPLLLSLLAEAKEHRSQESIVKWWDALTKSRSVVSCRVISEAYFSGYVEQAPPVTGDVTVAVTCEFADGASRTRRFPLWGNDRTWRLTGVQMDF